METRYIATNKRPTLSPRKAKLGFVYAAAVFVIFSADPEPSSIAFLVGLGAIASGIFLRVWAAGHLSKNDQLTTTGPYAYLKNPLYVGTFLIACGVCVMSRSRWSNSPLLANLNWIMLAMVIIVFFLYYLPYKKVRESERMRRRFGSLWEEYDRMVPDYVPRLTPFCSSDGNMERWQLDRFLMNSEHWTILAVTALVGGVIGRG